MTSIRCLFYSTIVLFLLSVCPLCSASTTKNLWGQKLKFKGTPCLWQLRPEAVIPALEELSTCLHVQRLVLTKWTGFVYKVPGKREIELGLGGSGEHLTVWLFGKEWNFPIHMATREWYYICLTWSGKTHELKIYIDGDTLNEVDLLPIASQDLAQNGTLTLGVSHFSVDGEVEIENGTDLVGEISQFGVWDRAYDAEDLRMLSCSDGNVVSWARDLQQRKYDCPPEPDSNQQCAWSHYKIQMQTYTVQSDHSSNCSGSLEKLTDDWLKTTFPPNISIQDISVSSLSHSCHMVNNCTSPQAQQPQVLEAHSNSSCDKCFSCEVFVNVHPATKVDVVQEQISKLLNFNSLSKSLRLTADPDSISVLPVGLSPTEVPSNISAAVTASNETTTVYLSPQPTDNFTTEDPLFGFSSTEVPSNASTAVTASNDSTTVNLSPQPTNNFTTEDPLFGFSSTHVPSTASSDVTTSRSSSTHVPSTISTAVTTSGSSSTDIPSTVSSIVTTSRSSSTRVPTTASSDVTTSGSSSTRVPSTASIDATTSGPSSTCVPSTASSGVTTSGSSSTRVPSTAGTGVTTSGSSSTGIPSSVSSIVTTSSSSSTHVPSTVSTDVTTSELSSTDDPCTASTDVTPSVSSTLVPSTVSTDVTTSDSSSTPVSSTASTDVTTSELSSTDIPSSASSIVTTSRSSPTRVPSTVVTTSGSPSTRVPSTTSSGVTTSGSSSTRVPSTINTVVTTLNPGNCSKEKTFSRVFGNYTWNETLPQVHVEQNCWEPINQKAYRLCELDKKGSARWTKPNFARCSALIPFSALDNVTVTPDNAGEVVDVVQDLVDNVLGNSEALTPSNLTSVVNKLGEVVNISNINPTVGNDIVTIIADILNSATDVAPVANTVLELTERMGDIMDIEDESLSITAPSLALSMVNAEQEQFSGLTFGVSSFSSTSDTEVFLNQSFAGEPLLENVATISLPATLGKLFQPGVRNTTRIHFQFFAAPELFEDPTISTQRNLNLTSTIVSASISNSHVFNLSLEDRVVVTFTHQPPEQAGDKLLCVFWDVQMNGGSGGWNGSGCEMRNISASQTSCLCDHLTHFGLLLDVSRTPISETDEAILTIISYLGCGLSSIFLSITILTYLSLKKLRKDYPSKILINLSIALLLLGLIFLLNSSLSPFYNYGLCISTAAILHYFLLASFTWMGLEAVHMYLALVRVFNTYIPSYLLKFSAVGWGIPLVIISLVLAIDKDAYGNALPGNPSVSLQSNESFCWIQNDIAFYVTVVAFIALILLGNMFVFVVVLIQIRRANANRRFANSRSTLQELRAVAGLTVLLGFTWLAGLFTAGPGRMVMMYLFVIFSSLQGFFVFLFHCLMKENVRKQWRALCCSDTKSFSHGSRSVNQGRRDRRNIFIHTDSQITNSTTSMGSSTRILSGPYRHQRA